MKRYAWSLAAFVLFFGCGVSRTLGGPVLYSDFGPGDSYDPLIGRTVAGAGSPGGQTFVQGNAFTAAITGPLCKIRIAIERVSGANALGLDLRADAAGAPGALLEHFAAVGQMAPFDGNLHPPVVVDSALMPLLTAGVQYWLVASPGQADTDAVWNFNSIGATGPVATSVNGGSFAVTTDTLSAFELDTCPEPASLTLLGLGIVGLLGLARRR